VIIIVGIEGFEPITTSPDKAEIHQAEPTVKIYDPAARPEMVVLVPVPIVVVPSGVRVMVHVPLAGRPFNTTLPVGIKQEG